MHFLREIALNNDERATLKLHVGHEGGKSWTVKVNLGSQTLLEQIVDDATAPNGWIKREIDLTPWAGKTVWLSVSQSSTPDKEPGNAYWKSLEIQTQPLPKE